LFKLLKNFFLVLAVGALVFYFRVPLREQVLPLWQNLITKIFQPDPCKEPIPYVIGTFDKDFKISEDYFLDALAEAEAIWEKPSGLDLFNYAPADTETDTLKVNLIYDYRQQATSTLGSLGIAVKNTQASYDSLKAKFLALKSEYEKLKNTFEASVLAFNKKNDAYEKEVKSWNSKGGAPKSEYEKLEDTRVVLERESKALKATQDRLESMVDEINAMVVVLNRMAVALNLSVDKYNTINVARGESFEEGVYTSDGATRKIDIFEFSSRDKLVRVLAHELGHALALEHVADPKAIMYELNQGESLALTDADLNALKIQCGK
jgi:hypothetical protein